MIDAVASERKLEQGSAKTRTGLDQCKEAARGHVQAAQGAAQQPDGFAHQPVRLVGNECLVHREHGGSVAFGPDQPDADVELVGAQAQNGIFEFTCHLQRIPVGCSSLDLSDRAGLCSGRGFNRQACRAPATVDGDMNVGIIQRVSGDAAGQWC